MILLAQQPPVWEAALVIGGLLSFLTMLSVGIYYYEKWEKKRNQGRKRKTRDILDGQLHPDKPVEWVVIFNASANGSEPYTYETLVTESHRFIREKTLEIAERWKERAALHFFHQDIKEDKLTFEVSYERK